MQVPRKTLVTEKNSGNFSPLFKEWNFNTTGMQNLLRKVSIALVCTIILIFLVAAGADETGIYIADTVSQSVQSITSGDAVFIGLFSAWLLIVGEMCRTLENIPGIKTKSQHFTAHKS